MTVTKNPPEIGDVGNMRSVVGFDREPRLSPIRPRITNDEGLVTNSSEGKTVKASAPLQLIWSDDSWEGGSSLFPVPPTETENKFVALVRRKGTELSGKDYTMGQYVCEHELLDNITYDSMFMAAVYSILSAAEIYSKQLKVFRALHRAGLNTPTAMLENTDTLKSVIGKARWPNSKYDYVTRLAEYWKVTDFAGCVWTDVFCNRRGHALELRERMAKEVRGMAQKTSSLWLMKLGYDNLCCIDIWVVRWLNALGHEVRIPEYQVTRGLTGKPYLDAEKIMFELAEEREVSPALLSTTVWAKYSSWTSNSLGPGQLRITDYL